jgi:hypothetical protein
MEQPMSSICQASEIEWKELLTKGITTGAIAALASMLLFENEGHLLYTSCSTVLPLPFSNLLPLHVLLFFDSSLKFPFFDPCRQSEIFYTLHCFSCCKEF